MTGVATVLAATAQISGNRASAMLESVSTSIQEVRRPLKTPDEVMKLPWCAEGWGWAGVGWWGAFGVCGWKKSDSGSADGVLGDGGRI